MTRSKFRQQVFAGKDGTNSLAMIPPQSNDGTLITGIGIDRMGASSALVTFAAAAASGAPDTAVALIKIRHCATLGGTYADFLTLESALDIDAAGKYQEYMLKLDGAKQFINMTVDITYTGGTTPANIVCAQAILGDFDIDPKRSQSVLG